MIAVGPLVHHLLRLVCGGSALRKFRSGDYQKMKKVIGRQNCFLKDTKRSYLCGIMCVSKRILCISYCPFSFTVAGALTVIGLASTFAVEELGFEAFDLITLILVLQFVAIIGAEAAARISGKKGNKFTIVIILLIWMAACAAVYFVFEKAQFYVIAAFVGLVMGGIQSMSRSTYSKLIPEDAHSTASFFSFFDVCEKLSMVLGPFIFGFIAFLYGEYA